ncbi:MAG: efflux RND transporter permease subunit [Alphaproteobacteria bacterium]|nr:efflux RND transporter permease subunit [Alphaproteobacteria bacterium]
MRRWLPSLAFDRPVTVLMVFLALLVLGTLGYARIPLQMMPDGFEPRFLWIRVPFANASPSETDDLVVRPVEEQLSTLAGLKSLESTAGANSATFELEFQPSIPMAQAYNDTVDRLERAMPDLPSEVERYWIFKFNPADSPVLWAGMTFPDEVEDPYGLVDKVIVPRIERIPGVASVDLWGVNGRRLFIDYDREQILAHAVDLGSVQRKLSTDNFQMSGGRLVQDGQVRHVRSLARIDDIELFERYPLRSDGLVLGDIADVSFRGVASADINRVNGRKAAAIAVRKESSANTVDVTEAIAVVLDELAADPRTKGATFFPFFDQGALIASAVDTLRNAALTGGLLSVVILWLFLREWRMTLLIAAAIPFSLLITIAVLYLRGDSLNLIAMMGLLLAVGMVVDNAIVVVEAIYQRRALGDDVREAAVAGTGEVGLAIVASTATSMVVFLPVILMTEDADAAFFLGVLGLPVVFALGASLVVALVFAPLATRFIRGGQIKPDPAWLQALSRGYDRALAGVLRWRADSTIGLILATALTLTIAVKGVGCTQGGEGGLNDFVIRFSVPADATPDERDTIVDAFEEVLEAHKEAWGVRVYRVQLGGSSVRGRAYVYLEEEGPMSRRDVIAAAKKELPTELPGVKASIGWEGQSGDDKQITLSIYGEDLSVLEGLSDEVVRRVRAVDGVLGAELADEDDPRQEIRLLPDQDALRRYGLTAQAVGQTVAFAMRGNALEPVVEGDNEIEVESRLSLEDRSDIGTLLDFPVFSPATRSLVPVRALTDVTYAKGPGNIRRNERRTSVGITVDLAQGVEKEEVVSGIDAALADMVLPRGYSWDAGDWAEDLAAENGAIFFAFFMSVVFVYLLMGLLFESWILPMAIITTIPMAMAGAFWGLYLTDTDMDTMAGIGLVVLVGVVVNNGIVLVDFITQLRGEGMERSEAIREACQRRLRPILMTAVTTITGLVPMAMGSSDFIGIPYAPLGRTVIGGLTAATALTLLFVPYMYVLLDDLRETSLQVRAFSLSRKT